MEKILIDGARGEGGGQVLRSALALALLTGKPFRMVNIRARRSQPGLMPQHLQAVEAAAAVGMARTEGAQLGSQALLFEPTVIRAGRFRFDIGTAGSTSLVLQTILLPLSFARESSSIILTGGTHVPWSPCYHYLDMHWLRYMRAIGFDFDLQLELAGFYPQGGGRVCATIRPAGELTPLRRVERGALKCIRGLSAVANLDLSVAERQRRRASSSLAGRCPEVQIEILQMPSQFKGTLLLLLAEFEHAQCCYYGLGARGKPAEQVAEEAVDALLAFLATDGAIDEHLADQLVLPLAVTAGASELRTSKVTQHLVTNAEVVREFLPATIEVTGAIGQPGSVCISGVALSEPRHPHTSA